ncbi:hypothetical protein ACS0TY_027450 [Phlomoides rotata]
MLPWKKDKQMAPLKIQDFLYGIEWGEKIDNMFAEVLADQATLRNYSCNGGDNSNVIATAQYVINMSFKKKFDFKKCNRQANKLKKRHSVFSWLLSLDGFHYDQSTKRTHASKEVELFAHAYEVYGDPCWDNLKIIFGSPPVVVPQPIPISMHREIIEIICDEDEVVMIENGTDKEVIHVDSSSNNTHNTSYWNNLANYNDDSDSETSPSIKTESSTTNNNMTFESPTKEMSTRMLDWSPWKKW